MEGHGVRANVLYMVPVLLVICLLAGCKAKTGKKTHFQQGVEYFDSGQFSDAAHEFDLAYVEDDKNSRALFNEGLCYLKTDNFSMAVETYNGYLVTHSDSAYAHINLAFAYAGQASNSLARQHFEQAISLDKTYAYPYCAYAQYQIAKKNRQADKIALSLLETATEMERRDSSAHYLLGVVQERFSNSQAARSAFASAVEYDADNQQALVRLASYEVKEQRHADALTHYIRAAVLDKNDSEAFRGAGICFRELGNHPKSLESLFKAKGINNADEATDRQLTLSALDYLIAQTEFLLHGGQGSSLTADEIRTLQQDLNRLTKQRQQWKAILDK